MSDRRARTRQIGVRFTPAEYADAIERATACGMTLPEYVRALISASVRAAATGKTQP